MYQTCFKRPLSFLFALLGVILLSWLYLILIIAIKLDSRGPVFFKQKRVGIHKTYFNILKFRTMRVDTPHDVPTHMLEDPDQYITRVGHFLRRTSLDELPQLFNILAGDMDIIGPRPALWNQYDLIAERDKYGANDIRPGLTGWAQIHGRDELEIEEKARLDGFYVKHAGLLMDICCFVGTIAAVLKSDGVVEGGTGAMKTEKKAPGARKTDKKEAPGTRKAEKKKASGAGKTGKKKASGAGKTGKKNVTGAGKTRKKKLPEVAKTGKKKASGAGKTEKKKISGVRKIKKVKCLKRGKIRRRQ